MPPEVETPEAPPAVQVQPAPEAAAAPPETPAAEVAVGEGAPPAEAERELSLLEVMEDPERYAAAIAAGATAKDFQDAILEQAQASTPDAVRTEAERLLQEQQAAEQELREREGSFLELDTMGARAAASLTKRAEQYHRLLEEDPDAAYEQLTARNERGGLALIDEVNQVMAGAIAGKTLEFQRDLTGILESREGAMKRIKTEELRQARLSFARGDTKPFLELVVKAVEAEASEKALEKGAKQGEKKAEASERTAQLLKTLREANLLTAPRVGGGAPPSKARSDAELKADPTTPISVLEEIRARERRGG